MIFRLSHAIATKIKVTPKVSLPRDRNPFADWSADLFTVDEVQYIILTNTRSLYTLVMDANGIEDKGQFLDAALSQLRECLPADGLEVAFRDFIGPASRKARFSKALNKAVTGSVNDLVYHAQVHLIRYNVPPNEIFCTLNDMPMSYLHHKSPRVAFRAMSMERESP